MFRKLLILAAMLVWPSIARAEWHEASSAHFVVYSDDRPERLREFATNLERYDKALRFFRGYPDNPVGPANRLRVYFVDNVAAVEKLIGRDNVAGFYQPRAGGSVAFVPRRTDWGGTSQALAVLLHEYAHHFMMSLSPHTAYPQWLVEGWAEFHGSATFGKDGSVSFGVVPIGRAYGLVDGNWLPIDKLLVAETLKLNGEQTEGLYGRGWLLTHYLTYAPARKGQLGAYIAALNQGKSSIEAAAAFGDLAQLDKDLEKYKRGKLIYQRIAASALPIGEVVLRKLTPGEAATMDVRIRSKNGVDAETAPPVYEAAKKAAAPWPNDVGAQLVLAEAAFDAQDYGAAEAAADRAIAADAKAVDAHLYKAMARMELAAKAGDDKPATWSAIRRIVVTANKLDPEDPEPLILYYRSFVEAGQEPPKMAREGLYYAFALAPQDPGLRMNVAQVYRRDGQPDMARSLLRPLAFDPHRGPMASVAAKMIADIDNGVTPGAVETVEEEEAE